jgi:hypothetical protein
MAATVYKTISLICRRARAFGKSLSSLSSEKRVKNATCPAYAKMIFAIARHASCTLGEGEKAETCAGPSLTRVTPIIPVRTAPTILTKLTEEM